MCQLQSSQRDLQACSTGVDPTYIAGSPLSQHRTTGEHPSLPPRRCCNTTQNLATASSVVRKATAVVRKEESPYLRGAVVGMTKLRMGGETVNVVAKSKKAFDGCADLHCSSSQSQPLKPCTQKPLAQTQLRHRASRSGVHNSFGGAAKTC